MAAEPARARRPAVWPWLVMPVIVLLVFCALHRMHRQPDNASAVAPPSATAADAGGDSTARE